MSEEKIGPIRSIQILAIKSVEDPDYEDFYRGVCRWYSTTFSTPLHYTEQNLTEEHILRHYYEHKYGELYEKAHLEEEAKERWNRLKVSVVAPDSVEQIDSEDDDWVEQELQKIRDENEKGSSEELPDLTTRGGSEDATPSWT